MTVVNVFQQVAAVFKNDAINLPFFKQSFAAFGPLLLSTVVGMTLGYSAVLIPQLQDPHTSSISITNEEASWVASLVSVPMAIGCLVGAACIQKYGRKRTHIIACLPYSIGWIVIYYSSGLEMLLSGRFITGLSAGMLGPASGVYIGETSSPKFRGIFLAGIPLAVALGVLITHLLGTLLPWQTTALLTSLLPIISWLLMLFTPESPHWLLLTGKLEKAQNAFYYLRGETDESTEELNQMVAKHKNQPIQTSFKLQNLTSPEFWKPLSILLVFFITSQWAGANAVNFYSITFMKETLGNTFNEYWATIFIDCIRIVAGIVSCIVMRKLGRRPLSFIGGIGTSLPLFMLSAYIYFGRDAQIAALPMSCLVAYIFFTYVGFVSLPWNLLGELLPIQHRSLGSGIASFVAYVAIFSVVKTMPSMFVNVHVEGTFLVYGSIALGGTVFLYFCLPETKGRTLHEIEEYFRTNIDTRL